MTMRTLALILAAGVLAPTAVPYAALAAPADLVPPATHSPLDPVRLAADFAPDAPAAPDVLPFELAAADSGFSPADSAASPADSLSPAGTAGPPLASGAAVPGDQQPSIVGPILGAVVGGAFGLYGGGALGLVIFGGDHYSTDEFEDLAAVFFGASVGELLLMPAGAHLGNGSRGSYWSALGGSALGYLATVGFSFAGPIGTVAGLLLQTTLTVSAERRAAKEKMKERAAEEAQAPSP